MAEVVQALRCARRKLLGPSEGSFANVSGCVEVHEKSNAVNGRWARTMGEAAHREPTEVWKQQTARLRWLLQWYNT